MNFKAVSLAAVATALIAVPAFAHHSFAMFDSSKTVTFKGTVKELEWTNPHSWLRITVKDEASGKDANWALEMGPPARQIQRGWKPDSPRPGDPVTVHIHPRRDGSRGGQLVGATLPDGRACGRAGSPECR